MTELQSRYTQQGKNRGIVILLLICASLASLVTIIEFDSPRFTGGEVIIGIISIILSLAVLIWFIKDSKALYPIFIIGVSLVLIASFFAAEAAVSPIILAGLVNYPIYYALFHYDQFIVEKEVESSAGDELQSNIVSDI